MIKQLLCGLLVLVTPAFVRAQSEGSSYDAEALSESGFQVAYGVSDAVPGGQFLLAAYVVFALLLGGYVVTLAKRQQAVQRELAELRKALEDIDDQLDAAG
ncbi:MAG: CcmD family protein [Bradymonadia bacterium]|jgi:CcmD family protein